MSYKWNEPEIPRAITLIATHELKVANMPVTGYERFVKYVPWGDEPKYDDHGQVVNGFKMRFKYAIPRISVHYEGISIKGGLEMGSVYIDSPTGIMYYALSKGRFVNTDSLLESFQLPTRLFLAYSTFAEISKETYKHT